VVRVAILAALLLTSACGRDEIGAENARAYFLDHRASLERVVEQVQLCQPETGRIERTSAFRCSTTQGAPQNLIAAMTASDVEWLRAGYRTTEGESPSLSSIHLAIHSYGFSFAGSIESYIYEVTPETDADYERQDDGIAVVERQPVTDAPHHWYWQKIDR